ncbi:MAG TPA: tetratricopeptide repeat protein [Candidatus Acidoferrales bacterium]|nr:tetratricopeptide repeat protein [Candidatus Acidoferrales bacterium]
MPRHKNTATKTHRGLLKSAARCFVVILLLAINGSAVCAQDLSDPVVVSQGGNPTGMLIVYLTGDDGTPVTTSGVVTIFRAGEVSGRHENTGSNGVVRFIQLANAAYTIVISVPGYKDARTEADITPNHSAAEVTVTMERLAGDAADEGNAKGIVLAPKAKKEAQDGIDAMRAGKYEEAEKHLKAAYKLAPGNPDVNDRLGELYLETRDYEKADSYLKQALSLDPDNAGALTDMGWLRMQQGDDVAAETALEHAISLDPQRWFSHYVLGVTYLRERDYERGRSEAATAIKVGKGAAVDAEYLLGECLAASGRNDEAVKELQEFLRDGPNNTNAKAAEKLITNLRAAGPHAVTQATDGAKQGSASNDTKPESH